MTLKYTYMSEQPSNQTWLKRIGWAGFFFFLIKGLIWLFVLWGGKSLLGL